MPPKNLKGGSAKEKPREDEREATLQAVVLADSYERMFAPFTLERPRCLLPLANTPLIEYTLEFLANAGVEDIFIFCGAHTEQVEDYINASKWKLSSSPFSTLVLLKPSATSIGDVMRDLDKRDLIKGDFLLVSGDVVCNLTIEPALTRHRARREKDKNAIMTMVLREAGVEHRTKSRGRKPVFVINPKAERCLQYEEITAHRHGDHYLSLDAELLTMNEVIEIREDLIDCYIDICTPDVLGLWSDNFDYQSVRKSFLSGVLKDYELNGKTIHTHIVKEQYAARVRSLRAYDVVSKDIIGRWAYPLCPDTNLIKDQTYRLTKGNTYYEDGVVLARGSKVNKMSVIGKNTSIGDGSVISNSVLGRRCQIGRNVVITGSYIWDDVAIGDNTTIHQAIIANESVVGRSCVISPGALLSYGVRIADNTTIPLNTRLTRISPKAMPAPSDASLVGQKGEGHTYLSDSDSDSSASTASASIHIMPKHRRTSQSSTSSLSTLHSHSQPPSSPRSRLSSFHSDTTDPTTTSTNRRTQDFHQEATASILDGMTKSDSASVIHLELLSQRLSANASDHHIRAALASAFITRIANLIAAGTPASVATKSIFEAYKSLVSQLAIFDLGVPGPKYDQRDWLSELERGCRNLPPREAERVLLFVVKEAHAVGVVEGEGVLAWWEGGGQKGEGEGEEKEKEKNKEKVQVQGRALVAGFVDWLLLAEESESESESDSEEESEEEED